MSRLFIAEKRDIAVAIADHLWSGHYNKNQHYFSSDSDPSGDCVTWASGHILGLAAPDDYPEWKGMKRNFYPLFPEKWMLVPIARTKAQLDAIGELLKQFPTVVNGGDADREGQLLVDEILNYFDYQGERLRIFITAKDDVSMKRAFSNIQEDSKYHSLYMAGLIRARCDWLVGMNLSRAYNAEARRSGYPTFGEFRFRIGRVKMPTLALVVRREQEIQNFKSVPFYLLKAIFRKNGVPIRATFLPSEDFPSLDSEGRIRDKQAVLHLIPELSKENGTITELKTERFHKKPQKPHSLDSLQIMANKRFGLSPNKTLEIVQKLYEEKLVTYPRSDCNYLPVSQQADAPVILQNLANSGIPGIFHEASGADPSYSKSDCWNDKKVSVHTAIVPTMQPVSSNDLSQDERDVYFLIAFQYILQFYPEYVYEQTSFQIACGNYTFKGSGRKNIDLGFRKIYEPMLDDSVQNPEEDEKDELPPLMKGDVLGVPSLSVTDKKTTPPKRFTEGSLIAAMSKIWLFIDPKNPNREKLKEIKGIGTPATRAKIIEELLAVKLNGRETKPYLAKKKKELIPTDFGFFTIKNIHESLTKPDLTADIEYQLSEIIKNESLADSVMNNLKQMVRDNIDFADKGHFPPPEGAVSCPICGNGFLAKHTSKDGKTNYYTCGNPNCVSPFDGKTIFYPEFNGKPLIAFCPDCGLPLSLSKPNPFTGKNFFICRRCTSEKNKIWENDNGHIGTEVIFSPQPKLVRQADSVDCPICHKGFLVPKVSSRGVPYFSCSDSHCKFHDERMMFEDKGGKPFIQECPSCHSPMQHRWSKDHSKEFYICYECDHWFPVIDGKLQYMLCPDCHKLIHILPSKKNPGTFVYLCDNAEGHHGQKTTWFKLEDGKLVHSEISFSIPPRQPDSVDCPLCHKGYLYKLISKKTGHAFYKCSNPDCECAQKLAFDDKGGKPLLELCPSCGKPLLYRVSAKTGKPFFVCNHEDKFFDVVNDKPVMQKSRSSKGKGKEHVLKKH